MTMLGRRDECCASEDHRSPHRRIHVTARHAQFDRAHLDIEL